ncbi:DUF551 domain-containing protein [Escherichia coli]
MIPAPLAFASKESDMSAITKERIKLFIKNPLDNGLTRGEQMELARIALASLEAEPVSQTYKLTFEQWLEQQHDKIDVDCGCVSTEMFMHWIRVAYEAGNSPVTPDGWISCSERMPPQDDWILIYSKHGEYMAGQVQGEYVELSDGTLSWLGNVLFWMPLPEPPQEAK